MAATHEVGITIMGSVDFSKPRPLEPQRLVIIAESIVCPAIGIAVDVQDVIKHRVTRSRIKLFPTELRVGTQQTQLISFLRQIPPHAGPPVLQPPPQKL